MQKGNNEIYVEAIKAAVGSVQYKGISVKLTFINAVECLYCYYEQMDNREYLETVLLHIQAYLEMGFSYEEGKQVFDKVLLLLGVTREYQFPRKFYYARQIKLNKTQIRSIIRRWPASPKQSMKIDEVIADIIRKIRCREQGIFYYQCAVTKDMYELVISKEETFLHDLRRNVFYTFIV